MPLFVNEEKDKKENKAIKEFTDRVEPRNVFWKNYKLIETAMETNEKIPIQVVNFYGIGGTGKTRLLKQLRLEMKNNEKEAKICYIDFEKLKTFNGEPASILNAIKVELKNKFNYEFPLFELAYYEYKIKLGVDISKPELRNILLKNKELNFLASFIEEIPLVGTFSKILSIVDEGASILRNRLNDSNLKSKIENIQNITAQEQEEMLSYYFALDFQNNLKKEKYPFVFQIDTYERLVNELTEVGNVNKIDDWLKGKDGLIRNVNNVLWVIAGREKLKWESQDKNWKGSLDQHLLGDLSQNDSATFLKTAGITDEKLIEQLYNLTSGTPIFLDMCVDTYYKLIESNKEIVIEEFGGDRIKLVERFFTYMNDTEKDFVTVLAFIENWTDDTIESQIKPILGNFSFSLYEKIKQFSFVIQEGLNYKIHETIRGVITEEASELIRNKFNKARKDSKEEKIKQIEEITVETIKKENIQKEYENSEEKNKMKKEYVSEIYIHSVKREEYRKVIDEIVSDIIDFLYKKPKFTKENKKIYCDMLNNLMLKIEQFLEKYDVRYDYKKIESILNYKIFKNTYEYKRLEGLYACLKRYYYMLDGKHYYEFGNSAYKSIIKHYSKTKNLYKENEEKVKQITFITKILGNADYTINMNNEISKKEFFSAKELDTYMGILDKHYISHTTVEYMLLKYMRRDYKKFLAIYDKFLQENINTENVYYQRIIIRLALNIIFEEFKGKAGTGYKMREYSLKKEAKKRIEQSHSNLIDQNEIDNMIYEYVSDSRDKFVNKYIDIVISYVNNNKTLVDETFLDICIKLLETIGVGKLVSDEAKIKLAEMLVEIKNEILYSKNANLIEKYAKLLFLVLKIPIYVKQKYFKENEKRYEKLVNNSFVTLDELYNKMIEIHGKWSKKAEIIECTYKINTLIQYNNWDLIIKIYKKYTGNNYSYSKLKLIKEEINKYMKCIKNADLLTVKQLEELYNIMFDEYEKEMNEYFENYKNISSWKQNKINDDWYTFLKLPVEIFNKNGDIKYFEKIMDYLYKKIEKFNILPTIDMYKNFSVLLNLMWESAMNPKNNEMIDKSFKILDKVFNKKGIPKFDKKGIYENIDFRRDMSLYATLILLQISYKKYLSNDEISNYISFKEENKNKKYDITESNIGIYIELTEWNKKYIERLNEGYYLIKDNMTRWCNKVAVRNIVNELYLTEPKSNRYVNKEFYQLKRCLYSVIIGLEWKGELENTFNKIVNKNVKGLLKDKKNFEYYIKLKEIINTIISYNIGNFVSIQEVRAKIKT